MKLQTKPFAVFLIHLVPQWPADCSNDYGTPFRWSTCFTGKVGGESSIFFSEVHQFVSHQLAWTSSLVVSSSRHLSLSERPIAMSAMNRGALPVSEVARQQAMMFCYLLICSLSLFLLPAKRLPCSLPNSLLLVLRTRLHVPSFVLYWLVQWPLLDHQPQYARTNHVSLYYPNDNAIFVLINPLIAI